MRLNVMIADDDNDIHKYLCTLVDWEQMSLSIVCHAKNIMEAQELFAVYQPQIVFMDVCMPGFDARTGLDVAREFREKNADTRIIVITGYADFDYARQALSIGTIDLLMKPLHREEVVASLQKAIAYYEEKRRRITSLSTMKRIIDHNRDVLQTRELAKLFEADECVETESWNAKLALLDVDIRNPKYTVIQMQLEMGGANQNGSTEYTDVIRELFSQMLAENGYKSCVYLADDGTLHYLASWSCPNGNEKLEELLNKVCDDAFLCFQQRLKAGIGITITRLRDVRQSVLTARRYLNGIGFPHSDRVVNSHNFEPAPDPAQERTEQSAMEGYLRALDYRNVSDELERTLESSDMTEEETREYVADYLLRLSRIASDCGVYLLKKGDYLKQFRYIAAESNMRNVQNMLLSITRDVFAEIKAKADGTTNRSAEIISMSKRYVDQNITNPNLGLDDVCAHAGVTKIYFGRIFQREEQISFGTYLNMERVKLARRLLEDTELKVKDIAEQVGYSNTKYFSIIFKSVTNMTPLDYRRARRSDN